MGDVIHADFTQQDYDSGYLIKDEEEITGVYVGEMAALIEEGVVYAGLRDLEGIDEPAMLNMEEMNQFCVMWLGIFDPSELAEGE